MSTNSVAGLVSGLDTTALIDALVTSRSGPILLLQQRQAQKTAQLSAWKSFEAILVSLGVETERLGKASLWNTPQVTSSDEEVLTALAGSSTALGSYDFFVEQLAQAHQIQSVAYASRSEDVGSGTLSIQVGTKTTDLTVAAGTSLSDLADQINEATVGAAATIVRSDDGIQESFYLVLTSEETGAASQISVTSSLTGGTDPVLSTEVRAAQNAFLRLGDDMGLLLESTTNTFEDVVQGLDLTVHRAQLPGEIVSVDVARDVQGIQDVVANFVDRYNAMVGFVNGQFAFDPDIGRRPPLMGDGTLAGITADIRRTVTGPLAGATGSFVSLFSVGVRSGSDGTLTFDAGKLQEALESDFDSVADLFRASATFDVPGVEWISAPPGVDLRQKSVQIVVSQTATRAMLQGADVDVGSGILIDATNDTFRIEIDGILSEDLKLAHGNYNDGDALAAAVKNAVDDSDDLGALGIQVSFQDAGGGMGSLAFTSNRYGSDGTIQLMSVAGSALATHLGLSGVFDTKFAGDDAEGTIDGVTAEGTGQTLRVPTDEDDIGGLSFLVTLATPQTVTASFTEGMGRAASRTLDSLTDTAGGRLSRVSESIQRLINNMDEDIARKQDSLERYRARLARRYAALESTLGQLQSQGLFLSSQIAANQGRGGQFGLTTNS